MNKLAETYVLAMAKQAVLKKVRAAAKGVGRFALQLPIWMAGSTAVQGVMGKKPEVQRVTVPREKYQMMERGTLSNAIGKYRGN
jgi:hypothetical protein